MKILIRDSDSVVLFADNALEFTENPEGISGTDFVCGENVACESNSTIVDSPDMPTVFQGGIFNYINSEWGIVSQAAYDAMMLAAYKATVPTHIDDLQARIQLVKDGKLALVQPVIDAIVDAKQRAIAQIYFDKARTWSRQDQFVLMIAPEIGYDDAGLDAAFIAAAKI